MRIYRLLISSLILILLFHLTTAARVQLPKRQQITSSRSLAPIQTIDGGESSTRASPSTTRPSSSTTVHSASNTIIPSQTTTITSPAPIGNNGTTSDDGPTLPLTPKVTPGLGLAGALMTIGGLVYCLIGMRNKWLHISMSAGALSGLAVAVLIIYLMHPPVSEAVQGAFFVAVLFTSIIFGGLSLVFTDITEGLGCLLGGFCLAMWFLVLKSDGLIGSRSGRAIFIGVVSVAAWSLSFSRITRTYGLLVCISFAGATVTILGIDCFSRAGLKEFWMYLWDLNDNAFPLNTTHYPQTRGMRAEIAGIILIFLFGIISQSKLWMLVKERRERKHASRAQRSQSLDRLEAEVGRRVEAETNRDRVKWEAAYGNKADHEGPKDGMLRTSIVVKEIGSSPDDSIEMSSLGKGEDTKTDSQRPSAEERNLPMEAGDQDEIRAIDANGSPIMEDETHGIPVTTNPSSDHQTLDTMGRGYIHERASLQLSAPPPPPLQSFPYNTATGSLSGTIREHSVPSSPVEVQTNSRRGSKRLSGSLLARTFSNSSKRDRKSTSEEDLVGPYEDGRASSLAATRDMLEDDQASLSQLSLGESDTLSGPGEHPNSSSRPASVNESNTSQGTDKPVDKAGSVKEADTQDSPLEASQVLENDNEDDGRSKTRSHRTSRAQSVYSTVAESFTGSLAEHLPDKLSKIALSYRTNEWAKHLEVAEKPDMENLTEPESPGVQIDTAFAETVKEESQAKSVDEPKASTPAVFAVQGNTVTVAPPLRRSVTMPQSIDSASPIAPQLSRQSSAATISVQPATLKTTNRLSTNLGMLNMGGALSSNGHATRLAMRSSRVVSSGGLAGTSIAESPMEEELDRRKALERLVAPAPVHVPTTLIGQRESMMKHRISSTSFNQFSSMHNSNLTPVSAGSAHTSQPVSHSSQPAYPPNEPVHGLDDEDMPLSQRRQLVQARRRSSFAAPSVSAPRSLPSTYESQGPLPTLNVAQFNSHQPQPHSSAPSPQRREAMLASWRASMRNENSSPLTPPVADQGRRQAMMNERRQAEAVKTMQERATKARDDAFDDMMRRGDMLDLHKEAMRRMQNVANRHAE